MTFGVETRQIITGVGPVILALVPAVLWRVFSSGRIRLDSVRHAQGLKVATICLRFVPKTLRLRYLSGLSTQERSRTFSAGGYNRR